MADSPLRVMYPASLGRGGAERQMMLLARHLPKDRFDVSFILLGGLTPLGIEARRYGATVHSLNAPRRSSLPLPVFGARVAGRVVEFTRICRRERYDIVDAWLYLGYGMAAATRPWTGVPTLIAGRRSLSTFKSSFGWFDRLVDRVARRWSDVFVANSEAVAADVMLHEHIDPARIRVIRNGVEIPERSDPSVRRRLRSAWCVPPDAPAIGCVGSFKSGKGQALVVKAMASVSRRVPDAWLIFIGDGPERPAVERLVAELGIERVRFMGLVPDAWELNDGFDVVVSGSAAEGLPNAILEAAAAARPIVATDAGGTREIVLDGETGLLVPIGDVVELAAALTRLLTDAHLADRLGAAARGHASSTFGVERFVRETAALYEEMNERRAR